MDYKFDDAAVIRRADELYAARTTVATNRPHRAAPRLTFADLVAYLTEPERLLSMDEQRALFADKGLHADLRRLRAELAVFELPQLAAADSGQLETRKFPGGSLRWHPSRVSGQIYLLVQLDDFSAAPRALVVETVDGTQCKRRLPGPDGQGRILLVLDEAAAADATLLRAVADPTATGCLMR
jgi:hypothetical protein